MTEDRAVSLNLIRDEILHLTSSPLYRERIKNKAFPVIGEGNHRAKIMFIGEAPGKNEAATGRPFCGASGRILDELLGSISMDRKNVYITNIVKDRPPFNRDPTPKEIAAYAPFLDRQIAIIRPKIIVTLGRFSMRYIMGKYGLANLCGPIGALHGKTFETMLPYGKVFIGVQYHPAVAVYNARNIGMLKKDFSALARAARAK